jgi:CelD/BcsL family acetyltransferase involved in cellulose biosynthesis
MGRLWLMKIGYDEQFAHASPGQLLMLESIRQAAGQGRQSVGLLGVMEPWKKQWTREENLCVVLRGYPYGWRGLSRFAGDLTQTTWTKCGHALRRAPKVSAP